MKKINDTRIVFRADGNSTIGLGHIYRSLALVEMLQSEFNCLFITKEPDRKIYDLIETYCSAVGLSSVSLEDEREEIEHELLASDIVVLDGYHFDSEYQQFLKSKVKKLVIIDDLADKVYYADIIINQGDPSIQNRYRKQPYTKVLAGLEYVMVRKEFLIAARNKREISKVDSVFICMGGADPYNLTIKLLQACLLCNFIRSISVVTGSAYNSTIVLKKVIEESREKKTIIHEENITAERLVALIQKSHIAISPASSISLEVCCVKSGLLIGKVVDNQRFIYEKLVELGACASLENLISASIEEIKYYLEKLNSVQLVNSIMAKQSSIVDGFSGVRLLHEFNALADAEF